MNSISLFFGKLTLEKKALIITLTPILTVLLNLKPMLLGLAMLILLDLLTGIRKSLHLKKLKFNPFKKYFWQTMHSKGMRDTWRKTYEYGIGIITFIIFETMILKISPIALGNAVFTLSELAVVAATLVEIYSVFENMEAVSGRNMLKKVQFLFPEWLKKLLENKPKINVETAINIHQVIKEEGESKEDSNESTPEER
tara:strand:+ start:35751 stop:36344 length:594 start_codon:yes stop_codon:yes gene_type:complete